MPVLTGLNKTIDIKCYQVKSEEVEKDVADGIATISKKVAEVKCGRANTMIRTDAGEVHICGNDDFGQLAKHKGEDDDEFQDENDDQNKQIFQKINFKVPIKQIACGESHMFVLSKEDLVWCWGRNDKGQLGLGFVSKKVTTPTKAQI